MTSEPVTAEVVAETVGRFWALGGRRVDLGGAALTLHPDRHPLGTFVSHVRTDDVAAVLARSAEVLAEPCSRVVVDDRMPQAAEAWLAAHDWELDTLLQLVLPAAVAPPPPTRALRPATDADWTGIAALFRLDHEEEDARAGVPPRPAAATDAAVRLRRSLLPAVTYFVDDAVTAFVGAWPGDSGVGMVEDVFVRGDARGAGLATDLLRAAVAHVRAHGGGPVVIGAEVTDTPKHLYRRFGFRPTSVARSWLRPAAAGGPRRRPAR